MLSPLTIRLNWIQSLYDKLFTLERLFQYLTLTAIRKVSKYFYTKPVQSSFNIMDVLHKRMEKPVLESTRSTARLVIPSRYFLVHCQLSKHLKNLQNLFKVNNNFTHSGLENDKDNFKAAKRQLQKMILKKKNLTFEKKLAKNRNKPKELWKALRSLDLILNKTNKSKIYL